MLTPALKCFRAGPTRVITDSSADYASLARQLLPDPCRCLEGARVLPGRGRSCVTAVVHLEGVPYLLKKYEYRGRWYGLRHMFKRSRALRVFANQRTAWSAGVPTPEPLVCIEERRLGQLRHCYVLCRYIPESETLDGCWESLLPEERATVLEQCGRALGMLHGCGITHGDSNWRNILITRQGGGLNPCFIDFDGSVRPLLLRKKLFRKDIQHFLRDMRWRKLPEHDIKLFVNAWQASTGSKLE